MTDLVSGFAEAVQLLLHRDADVEGIVLRTLLVSGVATLAAMLVGVPLGYVLARARFPGRTIVLGLVNTGMGMPPVVAGLFVWLMLVRNGPFGSFEMIYTVRAMAIAQFLIATPMVTGFTVASIQALPVGLPDLLRSLGASRVRAVWLLAREARLGLLTAVMAGFGAVISEVGASMMVGGNLKGQTRILTTAIVTETSRGQTERAIALGLLLLLLAFVVNLFLTRSQQARAG